MRHQPRDAVRLSMQEAAALGESALRAGGYDAEQARIVCAHLVDAAACGYAFAGLPRILEIADEKRLKQPRHDMKIIQESPVSAMIDGGNHIGYYTVYKATQIVIDKAKQSGIAVVGVYDSGLSGRNAYYVEMIARENLVGLQFSGASPIVAPEGGKRPMLGTNPLAVSFPTGKHPLVVDMGTAAIMKGELAIRHRLGESLPEGVAIDANGKPTCDPVVAMAGSLLAFGARDKHKGYALSLMVQAFGVLAGSTIPHGRPRDFGHLLIAIKPELLMPLEQLKQNMDQLLDEIRATPTVDGVNQVRVPSERAFRERDIAIKDGILIDRKVVEELRKMAGRGQAPVQG